MFGSKARICSGRNPEELCAILINTDGVDQVGLYDLDGTLHEGAFSHLKGMTNADLALYLAATMDLSFLPRFFRQGLDIYAYERRFITEQRDHEREQHIPILVEAFRESLLALPEEDVSRGINLLVQLRHRKAKSVLGKISARGVIVSCGFQEVVDRYADTFSFEKGYGNPLFAADKGHGTIYSWKDKKRVVEEYIPAERYVVIGDTYDDLGLARAAKERNSESVVIALHGRCPHLAKEADIIAPSWRALDEMLSDYM